MDDGTEELLLFERDGPVLIVRLNRPRHMNSLDRALHRALSAFWADVEHDTSVGAVVLTGSGRAFSAGGNLDEFEEFRTNLASRTASMRTARRLVDEMLNVPIPVVAAVNGPAVGLGCTLVTLCDIVFIAQSAHLADPHVSVALVAGDGGAVTWPHLTGMLKVKQYLLTGDPIPAEEAVSIGLANFAVPDADLIDQATAFAHRLAEMPPQAIQDTKAVLNQHLRLSAVSVLGYGIAAETHSHDTPAYAEAVVQLRNRRRG